MTDPAPNSPPPPPAGWWQGRGAGILLMLAGCFMFSTLDASVKWLSDRFDIVQLVWARYAFHLLIFVVLLPQNGIRATLRTRRPGLQVLRSLMLVASSMFFFTSIAYIQLAEAHAIGMVAPLLVTALSVPLLGEAVGWRRWTAVAVGFAGALVIIRPGLAEVQVATLLPLGMAVCYAAYQVMTRMLARHDTANTTSFYTAIVGVLALSAIVPFFWTAPGAAEWPMLAGLGLLGGVGHYCLILAYARAPAAVIAPFVYTQLLWAIVFGFVVFADLPDVWTFVGGGIVTASGLYVFSREFAQGRGRGKGRGAAG